MARVRLLGVVGVTHPTNNIVFIPIIGGPLDGQRAPWDTTRNPWPIPNGYTLDHTAGGLRLIHVWSPAHDAFVCRYHETLT